MPLSKAEKRGGLGPTASESETCIPSETMAPFDTRALVMLLSTVTSLQTVNRSTNFCTMIDIKYGRRATETEIGDERWER